jgi:hypothetical protein
MSLTTGLVAGYNMNNDWNDFSGGGFDLTATGATFSSPGKMFPFAGSFDGIDDRADAGLRVLNATGVFSVVTWVYFSAMTGVHVFISEIGNENTEGQYQFRILSSGQLQFLRRTGVGDAISVYASDANLSTGVWYHLAAVFGDASDSDITVYKDGGLFSGSVSASSYSTSSGTTTRLGTDERLTNDFNGMLQHPLLYNRVLTGDEVDRLYGGGNGLILPEQAPNTMMMGA